VALISEKRERFVALIAISSESGEAVAKAYTGAGYKAKTFHVARSAGFRLLKTVEIRQRLVELRNIPAAGARVEEKFVEVMSDIAAERKWVLSSLKNVAKRCMQAEPVLDSKGRPTGEYTFQASGANRSLELIGKELGMFVDKTDSTHRFESMKEMLERGTPEQLQAGLAELDNWLSAQGVKPKESVN
jgi:phage terminase small subunit